MSKYGIVLGTRPEIIKLSPIIRILDERNADYIIIHTNQHYTPSLDQIFFKELELPAPDHNLNIGSGKQSEQTAQMMIALERVYEKENVEMVVVQGDTNTVLAGAITATKMGVKVAHVEAGLRSFDRSMPEEINRIITDHVSDFLFPPTVTSKDQLLKENIDNEKIFMVGNTIVDAVWQNRELSSNKSNILNNLKLESNNYFVLTAHRAENTNNIERLKSILAGVNGVFKKYGCEIIYPIHPRTMHILKKNKLDVPEGLRIIDPLGYLDFIKLLGSSKLIITDSGGLQEEGCILKVPCVTLRDNTERPLTLEVGSNILAGTRAENIIKAVDLMLNKKRDWNNPFGDGTAGKKIVDILL